MWDKHTAAFFLRLSFFRSASKKKNFLFFLARLRYNKIKKYEQSQANGGDFFAVNSGQKPAGRHGCWTEHLL
jgi:hypothetical protein